MKAAYFVKTSSFSFQLLRPALRGIILCAAALWTGCEAIPNAAERGAAPPENALHSNGSPAKPSAGNDKKDAIRNEADALYCCGVEAVYRREFGKAVEYFEKAFQESNKIGEDPPEIHEALVECYQLLGGKHEEKIMEHIKKLTQLVPDDFVYHSQLGSIYGRLGNDEEAVAEYEKAAQCPPPTITAWRQLRFNQALLYRRLGQPVKSIEILEDLSQQKLSADETYNLNYLLAGSYMDLRELEKAIPFLEKCVALDHSGRDERMPFVCWQLGFCYAFAENMGAAEAIERATRLLLQIPGLHELRFWLAMLHRKQKDDNKAQQLLQEIIDGKYTRPRQAPLLRAYLELAQILIEQKDYPKAVATLQRGIAEIPQRNIQQQEARQLLLKLISTYSAMGEEDKVIEELDKMLASDPEFPAANNYLGYLYADKGIKLKEAIKLIERALKDQPDSGAYMDSLAWAYYKAASVNDEQDRLLLSYQKLKEALDLLKKNAQDLGDEFSDDPVVRDHLADAAFSLGLWEEARESWEISLRLSEKMSDRSPDLLPDVPYVKKKLDRVERLLKVEKEAPSGSPPQ